MVFNMQLAPLFLKFVLQKLWYNIDSIFPEVISDLLKYAYFDIFVCFCFDCGLTSR